jgi:hypothetical protein
MWRSWSLELFRPGPGIAQTCSNSGEFPVWHVFCSGGSVLFTPSQSRSVDVYVVATPSVAGVALGVPRTDAESTHVLCRHRDEATPDFMSRVLRRIARIRRNWRIGSLCYVVGPEVARDGSVPPLHSLMQEMESGTSLTVVGPGSSQGVLFSWIESILQRRHSGVTVKARLYADGVDLRLPRAQRRPHAVSPAQRPVATRTRFGLDRFPIEGAFLPGEGASAHAG